MEDDEPQHQPWRMPSSGDEEEEEDMESGSPAGNLHRSVSAIWDPRPGGYFPAKTPRSVGRMDNGRGPESDEARNLGAYFEEWDIPRAEQVVICRTWANYNVALERSLKNKKQKK